MYSNLEQLLNFILNGMCTFSSIGMLLLIKKGVVYYMYYLEPEEDSEVEEDSDEPTIVPDE